MLHSCCICVMSAPKQVSLKWDSFQDKVSSFLKGAKRSGDFSDVTLVCGDGKQIKAHRVVLASASPFFEEMFRRVTPHPHPLVYIRGLNSVELEQVLQFIYLGEASIAEEQLEAFLDLAEEFQLNALKNNQKAMAHNMGQCNKGKLIQQHVSTKDTVKVFENEKVNVDKSSEKVKLDKSSEKVKVDKSSELIRLKTELQVVTSQVARKAKEVTQYNTMTKTSSA